MEVQCQRKGEEQVKPFVLCGIDESGSPEAVRAAIDSSRKRGADLRLVGIVRERFSDSTRSLAGERVRRHKQVKLALERAAETARTAGLSVVTTIRGGDPARELAQEADAIGSGELFYVRSRGPIRAILSRRPRRELVHIAAATPSFVELSKAA
jgi:universal stress protein family protein